MTRKLHLELDLYLIETINRFKYDFKTNKTIVVRTIGLFDHKMILTRFWTAILFCSQLKYNGKATEKYFEINLFLSYYLQQWNHVHKAWIMVDQS